MHDTFVVSYTELQALAKLSQSECDRGFKLTPNLYSLREKIILCKWKARFSLNQNIRLLSSFIVRKLLYKWSYFFQLLRALIRTTVFFLSGWSDSIINSGCKIGYIITTFLRNFIKVTRHSWFSIIPFSSEYVWRIISGFRDLMFSHLTGKIFRSVSQAVEYAKTRTF